MAGRARRLWIGVVWVGAAAAMACPIACNAILGIRSYSADGGSPSEGGNDAGFDVSFDTGGSDTGMDSGTDSNVMMSSDAPEEDLMPPTGDAAKAAQGFPNAVIEAYCSQLATCCTDGGFDTDVCAKELGNVVGITYLGLILNGLTSNHYAFNEGQASICMSDISGLLCGDNSAATLTSLTRDCSSAYVGLLGEGKKGCQSSFDCKAGLYCAPVDSEGNTTGSSGTCTPLLAAGKVCEDTTYSSDCTYLGLGTGSTPLFCLPQGTVGSGGKCTAAQKNGTSCDMPGTPQQCVSQLCVQNDAGAFICGGSGPLTSSEGTDLCSEYVDGGS